MKEISYLRADVISVRSILTALTIYIHITSLIHIELRALDLCLLIRLKETLRNNRIRERNAANSSSQNAPAVEYAQKRLKRDYVPNGGGQTDEARSYRAGSSVITYWIGVIIQRIAGRRGAYTHNRPGVLRRVCARSAVAQQNYVYNPLKWPQRALIHDWRRGEIGLPATRHRRQFQRSNA